MTPQPDPDRRGHPSRSPVVRAVALFAALATVGGLGTALAAAVAGPGGRAGPVGPSRQANALPPAAVGSPEPLFRPSPLAEGEDDAGAAARRMPAAAGAASSGGPGDEPVEVRLPTIGVRSVLVPLGLAADGTMEVPGDFGTAGWLTAAPVPGARGPAVIAGHVDSTTGPAVFFRLRELDDGDPVEVRQRDGDVVRFVVRSRSTFAKDRFPTEQVYGPTAGPVLRLITCDGDIDPRTGRYTDNLVVFAS